MAARKKTAMRKFPRKKTTKKRVAKKKSDRKPRVTITSLRKQIEKLERDIAQKDRTISTLIEESDTRGRRIRDLIEKCLALEPKVAKLELSNRTLERQERDSRERASNAEYALDAVLNKLVRRR